MAANGAGARFRLGRQEAPATGSPFPRDLPCGDLRRLRCPLGFAGVALASHLSAFRSSVSSRSMGSGRTLGRFVLSLGSGSGPAKKARAMPQSTRSASGCVSKLPHELALAAYGLCP